jgi:hypothetical protein
MVEALHERVLEVLGEKNASPPVAAMGPLFEIARAR